MIPVYRLTGAAQSRVVIDRKPKRPWKGFAYLVLVLLAILAAYFVVLPLGQEVRGVFQRLTDAFSNGK